MLVMVADLNRRFHRAKQTKVTPLVVSLLVLRTAKSVNLCHVVREALAQRLIRPKQSHRTCLPMP